MNNHTKAFLKCGNDGKRIIDFIENHRKTDDLFLPIGYELFGPTLMGFCNWIYDTCTETGIDQISFLARDGQIVRKAYSLLYPGEYQYVLASRRSLTVPLLINATCFEDIIKIVPYIKREETIRDLLYKIGIEGDEVTKKIEKEYGQEISRAELLGEKGCKLYGEIEALMKSNASEELTACKKYISHMFRSNRIGLVDIGWYGTMQTSLEYVLNSIGEKRELTGLYFGFLRKAGVNERLNAKGYAYDFNRIETNFSPDLIYGFNGLIELMFTADHGSAKKYVVSDDDNAECILEANKGEYSKFVKQVQSGALQFISDWKSENEKPITNVDILYAALNDLLQNPTTDDCKNLGDLQFFDAYFEKLIQYPGFLKALRNPKSTVKNFLKSNWKIGYLKQMLPLLDSKSLYRLVNRVK